MKRTDGSQQSTECPECGGTHWIFKKVQGNSDFHFTPKGRQMPVGVEYAISCPKCGYKVKLGGSGIPGKYYSLGYDEERFWSVYRDNCAQQKAMVGSFVAKNPQWKYGLYIWSTQRGTGKTRLSCSILTSIKLKHEISIRFISVPDYLYKLRNSYRENTVDATSMVRELMDVGLLCLDDLGAEKRSEWTDQELYYLIDSRYRKGLKTIITSNNDITGLSEDSRLSDRIREICIEMHMPEQCIRTQQAFQQQHEFLQSMGL